MDVAAWLHGLGLEQYALAFDDDAVDGEVLRELTADDLKDLASSFPPLCVRGARRYGAGRPITLPQPCAPPQVSVGVVVALCASALPTVFGTRYAGRPAALRVRARDGRLPAGWLRPSGLLLRTAALCRQHAAARPARPHTDRRFQAAGQRRRAGALQSRDHLHRLFRQQRDRPHPAVRRHPARAVGGGMGAYRTGGHPAGDHSQPAARRHLPRAEDPQGSHHSRRSDPRQRQLPAGKSAASTSSATGTAPSECSRTTRAPLRGSAM